LLVKFLETYKDPKNIGLPHKGIVIDNKDILNLGRVKCFIEGFLEGEADQLPWIAPQKTDGGHAGEQNFKVPSIGAFVAVEFKYNDIYSGFYTGVWTDKLNNPSQFNEDYPNTSGSRDDAGNVFKVNKIKGTTEYKHSSGAAVKFDAEGNITLRTGGVVKFQSIDGGSEMVWNMATGEVTSVGQEGGNKWQGTISSIETSKHNVTVDELNTVVTGGVDTQISGNSQESVGGSKNEAITFSSDKVIGGTESKLVGLEASYTYGLSKTETVIAGSILTELLAGSYDVNLIAGSIGYSLAVGTYSVDVLAGDISLSTLVGTLNLSNTLASIGFNPAGGIDITTLVGFTVTDALQISLTAPLISLGLGLAPIVTILSDPLEDLVTGKPKLGVPTILAG